LSSEQVELLKKWSVTSTGVLQSWDQRYKQLENFVAHNNKIPERSSDDQTESSLARWCDRQKTRHQKGLLSTDQSHMLENVHPQWKWPCKMKKQTFGDWVNELKSWLEQHGRFPKRRSEYPHESRL
jgi:hypothetical protein